EGETRIARRSRDDAAEQECVVGTEELDQRAVSTACPLLAGAASILLVDVREDRAEPGDRCRDTPIRAGDEEQCLGDVAAGRGEQPRRTEGAEDGRVGRIVEECREPTLRPTRRGSLRKADSRCRELAAAGIQEYVERGDRGCRCSRTAAVPV